MHPGCSWACRYDYNLIRSEALTRVLVLAAAVVPGHKEGQQLASAPNHQCQAQRQLPVKDIEKQIYTHSIAALAVGPWKVLPAGLFPSPPTCPAHAIASFQTCHATCPGNIIELR
jgi:hypothetical protein